MHKPIFLSVLQTVIALSAAFPYISIRADESVTHERTAEFADSTSRMQRNNGFGIVPVTVPKPHSADKASVTLWDEIVPPSPLPMPIPLSPPGNGQHAMEGKRTYQ
ncbi:hypothetical protein C7H84_20720 [Burkholderia sp. Nafp2/4-1b]|nr:hypothetical protein C7H84_20720 [Burkholderia sp. Nafp2/4-1b]